MLSCPSCAIISPPGSTRQPHITAEIHFSSRRLGDSCRLFGPTCGMQLIVFRCRSHIAQSTRLRLIAAAVEHIMKLLPMPGAPNKHALALFPSRKYPRPIDSRQSTSCAQLFHIHGIPCWIAFPWRMRFFFGHRQHSPTLYPGNGTKTIHSTPEGIDLCAANLGNELSPTWLR